MDRIHGLQEYVRAADRLQFVNIWRQKVYNYLKRHLITHLPSVKPDIGPGQPRSTDVGTDHICLEWDKVENDEVSHYEIRMKVAGVNPWSTMVSTQDNQPSHRFNDLLQNTGYEFMVRAVYSDGQDSAFSYKSVEIKTECAEVCDILKYCRKIDEGPPSVNKLLLVEMHSSKDEDHRTRKCRYGNSTCIRGKTLLMVGPSRAGKTTLINGLVNYFLGVKWVHQYRLVITEEPEMASTCQESPTEWITCYKVHPVTSDTEFILNIIDTPGFSVEPGSDVSNQKLLVRLNFFLSTRGPKGMNGIDAVCFVCQANPVQFSGINKAFGVILDGIKSMFGNNIHENIIPMLTFADGTKPSALTTLSDVGVPTQCYFVFNSSTLFQPYIKDILLGKSCWELNSKGFEGFFNQLSNMKPCRAFKTNVVTTSLPSRTASKEESMTRLQGNRLEINEQLMDLANVQADRDTVKKFAFDIELTNSFSYDEEVYRQEKIPLAPGKHVTNCILCNTACHYPCDIPDNDGKRGCDAMEEDNCTVCHQHCVWQMHRNDTFRIEVKIEKVTKTYSDIKAKYEFDEEENVSADAMLQAIKRVFVSMLEEVHFLISKTVETSNRLQRIQQSETDFIDLMINTEEQEEKAGFEKRLDLLRAINSKIFARDPNTWLNEIIDW